MKIAGAWAASADTRASSATLLICCDSQRACSKAVRRLCRQALWSSSRSAMEASQAVRAHWDGIHLRPHRPQANTSARVPRDILVTQAHPCGWILKNNWLWSYSPIEPIPATDPMASRRPSGRYGPNFMTQSSQTCDTADILSESALPNRRNGGTMRAEPFGEPGYVPNHPR